MALAAAVLAAGGTTAGLVLSSFSPAPSFTLPVPHDDRLLTAIFSPDGEFLASEGVNRSGIYLWNVPARQYITTLAAPEPGDGQGAFAFAPDDKTLTFADSSGLAYRWNLSTFRRSVVHARPAYNAGSNVALSGDANILALADQASNGITLWDLRTGAVISDLTLPGNGRLPHWSDTTPPLYSPISLDHDGQRVAVTDNSGNAYIFDVRTRQVLVKLASWDALPSLLSPDGQTVASIAFGGQWQLRDIETKANVAPASWSPNLFLNPFFSSDGRVIVDQRNNGADVWNADTGSRITTVPIPKSGEGRLIAVSPGGKELVFDTSPVSFYNAP